MFQENGRERGFGGKLRWMMSGVSVRKDIKLLDGILSASGTLLRPDSEPAMWVLDMFRLALTYKATLSFQIQNTIGSVSETLQECDLEKTEVNRMFREILSVREETAGILRMMYETGFLEKMIPELAALKCKVEYDSFHEYTVDQHIMIALSNLDNLIHDKNGPLGKESRGFSDIYILRMAVLLHDIGKSLEGNHAYNGAVMASNICDRLGMGEGEKDVVVFLVLQHLELSKMAFHREPEEAVMTAFAQSVGDSRKLEMLYILTIVDIKSVGRKAWTEWIGIQLQSIYQKAKHVIENKGNTGTLILKIGSTALSPEQEHLTEELSTENDLALLMEPFPGFERITLCGFDRTHFFADVVGCLSSEGYNILSAQINTSSDSKVLDIFHVEPDTIVRIPSNRRVNNIKTRWEKIRSGKTTASALLEERLRLYPQKQTRISPDRELKISIDNDISPEYTVLEIDTADRFGLLYRIANCLAGLGVNIISAKLSTRVSRAADVFYVNSGGEKIENPELRERIREMLMDSLLSVF